MKKTNLEALCDMYTVTVAAGLCFERAMVGTGWTTSHPDYMNRLRKH